MLSKPTIYLIDNDTQSQKSMQWLVQSIGYGLESFGSATEFLDAYNHEIPGCLLSELALSDFSGCELLEELRRCQLTLPVIFLTQATAISTAVAIMKSGAFDCMEKPVGRQCLLERVREAVQFDTNFRRTLRIQQETRALLATLSRAKVEVMDRIVAGDLNKKMAADFGVTERAIEYRRSGLMKKLGTSSVVDLIRMTLISQRDYSTLPIEIHAAHAQPAPHLSRRTARNNSTH